MKTFVKTLMIAGLAVTVAMPVIADTTHKTTHVKKVATVSSTTTAPNGPGTDGMNPTAAPVDGNGPGSARHVESGMSGSNKNKTVTGASTDMDSNPPAVAPQTGH